MVKIIIYGIIYRGSIPLEYILSPTIKYINIFN